MLLTEDPPLDIPTPTGPMRTYRYRPVTEGRFPGIVLYSEIYQRTAPIHRIAQIIAGHGFVVAVPEIFHDLEPRGSVLAYDTAGTARGNACKVGRPVSAYDADARGVLDALVAWSACNGQLGSVGVCIGGHLAFRCAMQPDVRAAACFYPTDIHGGTLGQGGDDSLSRVGDIRGELMMVWGRQDPHIPDDGRAKIYGHLAKAGVRFAWHEHQAQHAFLRDEGHRYDPELALQSYAQLIALLHRSL
jgi:carboxymethylenebutenolidase